MEPDMAVKSNSLAPLSASIFPEPRREVTAVQVTGCYNLAIVLKQKRIDVSWSPQAHPMTADQ